jgi:DNA-binding NtrC family response regulator
MARILLADDNAAVRDLVRRALVSEGHTVHVTQDGAEALDHLSADPSAVDLLVTDVDMPQLDGLGLAAQALSIKPALPIVLMSGHADQLDKAAGLKAARLKSIGKPFTLEQIKTIVRAALA